MPIYTVNGETPSNIYYVKGNKVFNVYDSQGNELYFTDYPRLKVANYNVGGWYIGSGTNIPVADKAEYVTLQTNILAELDADICCFQEYWDEMCDDGTLASSIVDDYFEYINKTDTSTEWQGHAIATKDLEMSDYESFNFEHSTSGAKTYQKCYITIDDKDICIINTHLSSVEETMLLQFPELLTLIEDEEYFIIFGDFNTRITCLASGNVSQVIGSFTSEGCNTANASDDFGVFVTYYSASNTTSGDRYATDHIITSSNILINSVYINKDKLEDDIAQKIDHIPLIAELVIT